MKIYDTTIYDTKEEEVINYLNKNKYKKKPLELTGRWNKFDFVNKSRRIELKSRSCNHNTYKTVMMNIPKLDYCRNNPQYKYRFYFLYTDGLYRWDYIKNYKYEIKKGGRTDRGDPRDIRDYAYIDIKELKLVTKDLCSNLEKCLL
tara:strand:- start:2392 stop:2829 length:438 start_codon:yes stop_codon:yes gene_type:complete